MLNKHETYKEQYRYVITTLEDDFRYISVERIDLKSYPNSSYDDLNFSFLIEDAKLFTNLDQIIEFIKSDYFTLSEFTIRKVKIITTLEYNNYA